MDEFQQDQAVHDLDNAVKKGNGADLGPFASWAQVLRKIETILDRNFLMSEFR
jgi:hypothetical protein